MAENGKGEFLQPEWIRCLGHSSWTICSPLSLFCFPNFSTFSLSCWEANSYYPREGKTENGKGEFSHSELIGCIGHSSWTLQPIGNFVSQNVQLFNFYAGRPNYPREGNAKNGKGEFPPNLSGLGAALTY